MAKRILALAMCFVLVFSIAAPAYAVDHPAEQTTVESGGTTAPSAAPDEPYYAYLQVLNGDGTFGAFNYALAAVTGPGEYTVELNMADLCAYYEAYYEQLGVSYPGPYAIDGLSYLYIQIVGAYDDFSERGYRATNVQLDVDGDTVELDQDYVWTYPSSVSGQENDYIIELYNVYGVSAYYGYSAISGNDIDDFHCDTSITVTFTIDDTEAKDAHMMFFGQGEDWNGDPAPDGIGNLPGDFVYINPDTNDVITGTLPGCVEQIRGPGTYTMRWNMYDGYTATEMNYLYIEIDDAYQQYMEAGYTIENVSLIIDGIDYPVDQDAVWTGYNQLEGGDPDNFVFIIYNPYVPAIDTTGFECSEYIEVEFSIVDSDKRTAYLQFMGSGTDFLGNETTIGNYPSVEYSLPGTSFEIRGPGDYEVTWNMTEYFSGDFYDVNGITWLYVEIDNAFNEFVEKGYQIEDVYLVLDGWEEIYVEQNNVFTYASMVDGQKNDFVIELYNELGLGGNSATNYDPAVDPEDIYFSESITLSFTIVDGPDQTNADVDAHTGKWISEGEDPGTFELTLEGWVSGETIDINTPSDVVLVLDQSASMYTPVGLSGQKTCDELFTGYSAGLERYKTTPSDTTDNYTGMESILELLGDTSVDETGMTNAEKFAQLGYLVAQSRGGSHVFCQDANVKDRTHYAGSEVCRTWDWFVVQYNPGPDGEVGVNADGTLKDGCDDYLEMYRCENTSTPHLDSDGVEAHELDNNKITMYLSALNPNHFYFYKTQYGALLEAMTTFVNKLKETGVNHRIAVVGFASESDSWDYATTGTGLYVNGQYHTFNVDFPAHSLTAQTELHMQQYWGSFEIDYVSSSVHQCPYDEICGQCTDDPNETGGCPCYCRICVLAAMSIQEERDAAIPLYESVTYQVFGSGDEQIGQYYDQALVPLTTDYDEVMDNVLAVQCDYFFTNHYLGMYIAKRILEENQDPLTGDLVDLDGDDTEENIRQKRVILFTDGTPVNQNVQYDDGYDYTYKEYTNDLTIQYAREMERDYDAEVYAVCTSTINFDNLAGTEYLYYASSDFNGYTQIVRGVDPEAIETVEQGNELYASTDSQGNLTGLKFSYQSLEYYVRIESAEDLIKAFQRALVLGGTTSTLSGFASLQDIVYEDFELSDELIALIWQATADGEACNDTNYPDILDHLQVYLAAAEDGSNGTKGTADDFYNFPEKTTGLTFDPQSDYVYKLDEHEAGDDINVEIGQRADGRYYVRVDGFEYSDNYVSAVGRDTDDDGTKDFWGMKLVVVVPIQAKDGVSGAKIQSNYDTNALGSSSGIITFEMTDGGKVYNIKEAADFQKPAVDLPATVTVKKTVEGGNAASTDSFDFACEYQVFVEYDSINEVTSGSVLGGNYLKALGKTESKAESLTSGGEFTLNDVLVGEEFTISETLVGNYELIAVKVNDVTYTKDGTLPAWLEIDWETGEVHIIDAQPDMVIEFVNKRTVGDMTIVKAGANGTLDPDQSFIFHIKGNDEATADIDLTIVIKGNGQLVIQDLPVGSYLVSEDSGWSWRYTVKSVTGATLSSGTAYEAELVEQLTVTFTNTREEDKWMDGNSHCQNLFTEDGIKRKEGSNEDKS